MITKERIDELLILDFKTWEFFWKNPTSPRTKIGSKAGTTSKGYLVITIDKKLYKAHRLIWFYVYGEFPKDCIDHIDRNKLNNNPKNLRNVTPQENNQNITERHNSTGFSGIYWSSSKTKFVARISINRKKLHIGTFDDMVSARKAYLEAKKTYHPLSSVS